MIEGYYERKTQRVKCVKCGKTIRITGEFTGYKKHHKWVYIIDQGKIFKSKILYPLYLRCEVVEKPVKKKGV